MSEIRVGENESLENALKRFKRKCARAGIMAEARKESTMRSPASRERRRLRQQESVSIDVSGPNGIRRRAGLRL